MTDPLLLSLCYSALRNKGINLEKMFSIDTGKKDFFGHALPIGEGFEPGVCEINSNPGSRHLEVHFYFV